MKKGLGTSDLPAAGGCKEQQDPVLQEDRAWSSGLGTQTGGRPSLVARLKFGERRTTES